MDKSTDKTRQQLIDHGVSTAAYDEVKRRAKKETGDIYGSKSSKVMNYTSQRYRDNYDRIFGTK